MVEEGQVYNSRLWELSSAPESTQLFQSAQSRSDSETHQDADNGTVDLLLKVHEKGENSVGLNGGFSGLSGIFLGANYQTNNFLGLSRRSACRPPSAICRDTQRDLLDLPRRSVGNRPLSLGFQLSKQKTDYNASRSYHPLEGSNANFDAAQQSTIQNFNQSQTGWGYFGGLSDSSHLQAHRPRIR